MRARDEELVGRRHGVDEAGADRLDIERRALGDAAKQLGHHNVVGYLQQTLDEERTTDTMLTGLAESSVNRSAAA